MLEPTVDVLNFNKEALYVHSRFGPKNVIKCQPVGLRGPIMVVGYGNSYMDFDLLTDKNGNLITTKNRYNENVYVPIPNVVPNKIAYATGEGLAGPVDLMWDKYRGVWTSHDIVTGFAASNMRPFDDGYIYINMSGVKTNRTLFIKNFSTKKIYAGQSVVACYSVNDARWIVRGEQIKIKFDGQASDCPSPNTPTQQYSDFIVPLMQDECEPTEGMFYVNTNGATGTYAGLSFRNGLLKGASPSPPSPPCTESVEVVSGVTCGSDGSITVSKTTISLPCGSTSSTTTTTTPRPWYLNDVSDPLASYRPCYACSQTMGDVYSTHVNQANCLFALSLIQNPNC
jgi:hypothetical protein